MDDDFRRAALDYHRLPRPGKLAIEPTKRMATQRDLALAYSPGVAAACEAIVADPDAAYDYTARGNLVAVISNGTAVLGLGNIGALAGKPVMEGKAVLFKKFAGIDVFDIEVDAADPTRFCDVVAALEPTFGAINLEDIKAPECFAIEAELRRRMRIPVFHDDQHGTAITVAAAVRNGLLLQGKTAVDVKLVTSGRRRRGAGLRRSAGVDGTAAGERDADRHQRRGAARPRRHAAEHGALRPRHRRAERCRTCCRAPTSSWACPRRGVLKPEWLPLLAPKPLILALANPGAGDPARAGRAPRGRTRSSPPGAATIPTRSTTSCASRSSSAARWTCRRHHDQRGDEDRRGRSDRRAGARWRRSEVVAAAYGGAAPVFGPDYIIPKPFDPRLILEIAPGGGARRDGQRRCAPADPDFAAYQRELERFVFRSGQLMRPVFEAAKQRRKRIVYGEGEDERVLRAAQTLVDDGHRPADPARPARR